MFMKDKVVLVASIFALISLSDITWKNSTMNYFTLTKVYFSIPIWVGFWAEMIDFEFIYLVLVTLT